MQFVHNIGSADLVFADRAADKAFRPMEDFLDLIRFDRNKKNRSHRRRRAQKETEGRVGPEASPTSDDSGYCRGNKNDSGIDGESLGSISDDNVSLSSSSSREILHSEGAAEPTAASQVPLPPPPPAAPSLPPLGSSLLPAEEKGKPENGREASFRQPVPLMMMKSSTSTASSSNDSLDRGAGSSAGSRRARSSQIERGAVVYTGWLVKQGHVWRGWKRRFFVLQVRSDVMSSKKYGILQYYTNDRFSKLKGEISLADGPVTIRFLDIQKTGRPHCFEIVKGFYQFVCQARDEQECRAWVSNLLQLLPRQTTGDRERLSSPFPEYPGFTSAQGGSYRPDVALNQTGTVTRESMFLAFNQQLNVELQKLLEIGRTAEGNACQYFVRRFDNRSPTAVDEVRDFMNKMRDAILRHYGAGLIRFVDEPGTDEEEKLAILSKAVTRQVEESVFIPLHDAVYASLRRNLREETLSTFERKVHYLRGKSQAFFDIPLSQLSPTNWRTAIRILDTMGTHSLPSDKFDSLVCAIREIHDLHQLEKVKKRGGNVGVSDAGSSGRSLQLETGDRERQSQRSFKLSASTTDAMAASSTIDIDDLLPIFTYMLVNSNLESVLIVKELLFQMCDPWEASNMRQNGVELSILSLATEYILSVDIPGVLEDILRDQIFLTVEGDWRPGLELEEEHVYGLGAVVKSTASGQNLWEDMVMMMKVSKGSVLVSVNGKSVILQAFQETLSLLDVVPSPKRLGFLSPTQYHKILGSKAFYWENALFQACKRGSVEATRLLINNRVDVNCQKSNRNTPLHIAVQRRHRDVVELLLRGGADPNASGQLGRTPMHMLGVSIEAENPAAIEAVQSRDLAPVVDNLIQAQAEIDALDLFGNTPLMLCARIGCLEGVKAMLLHGADAEAHSWQLGYTALMWAAQEGQADCVAHLLDRGANPEARALDQSTPLHVAASVASGPCCELLLGTGKVNVNAQTLQGYSPLVVAASRGEVRSQFRRVTFRHDDKAVNGTVSKLLQSGADTKLVGRDYRTSLHFAVVYASLSTVTLLIEHAPEMADVKDINGCTPLDILTKKLLLCRAPSAVPSLSRTLSPSPLNYEESRRKAEDLPVLRWADNYKLVASHSRKLEEERRQAEEEEEPSFPAVEDEFKDCSLDLYVAWQDLKCELNDVNMLQIQCGKLDPVVAHLTSPQHFSPRDITAVICGAIKDEFSLQQLISVLRACFARAKPEFVEQWMNEIAADEVLASSIGIDIAAKNYLEDYGDVSAEAVLRSNSVPCVRLNMSERCRLVQRILLYSLELLLFYHEPTLLEQEKKKQALLRDKLEESERAMEEGEEEENRKAAEADPQSSTSTALDELTALANEIISMSVEDGDTAMMHVLSHFRLKKYTKYDTILHPGEGDAGDISGDELGSVSTSMSALTLEEEVLLEGLTAFARERKNSAYSELAAMIKAIQCGYPIATEGPTRARRHTVGALPVVDRSSGSSTSSIRLTPLARAKAKLVGVFSVDLDQNELSSTRSLPSDTRKRVSVTDSQKRATSLSSRLPAGGSPHTSGITKAHSLTPSPSAVLLGASTSPSIPSLSAKTASPLALTPTPTATAAEITPSSAHLVPTESLGPLELLDIPPQEMAKQLTLLAHYRYRQVPALELLAKGGDKRRPKLTEMKNLYRHLTFWVINEILINEDAAERSKVVGYYITLAANLRSPMHNFDGFMAIMSALQSSAIHRLKMTWARLTQKDKELWNELKAQVASGGRRLFTTIAQTPSPCVPYVGLYLQHIVALQEYPLYVEGKEMLNFKRIRGIGDLIRGFAKHQEVPYLIPPDGEILSMIYPRPLRYDSDESCYERSLRVEPRLQASTSKIDL